jgi:hypothetical protein
MRRPLVIASAVIALSGCATCREHPVFCAAATAVVVGSAVALAEAHHGGHSSPLPRCQQQPSALDCRPVMGP